MRHQCCCSVKEKLNLVDADMSLLFYLQHSRAAFQCKQQTALGILICCTQQIHLYSKSLTDPQTRERSMDLTDSQISVIEIKPLNVRLHLKKPMRANETLKNILVPPVQFRTNKYLYAFAFNQCPLLTQ